MEFKNLFLYAVFSSCLIGAALAVTGDSCDASAEQIHPETALNAEGSDYTYVHTTSTAFTKSAANSNKAAAFDGGNCANWALNDDGYDAPAKVYWASWEPTADIQATVVLTGPNDDSAWVTRIEILAQTNKTTSCGSWANNKIAGLWTCVAHIVDPCQGYPSPTPDYQFKAGVRYYFLLDSPSSSATSFTFKIINTGVQAYDMCSDDVECTTDTCDVSSGHCSHEVDTSVCSIKSTECHEYSCLPEPGVGEDVDIDGCYQTIDLSSCDDGRYCTEDTCDSEGYCDHVAVKSRCNDGMGCTKDTCWTEEDSSAEGVDVDEEGCQYEIDCDDLVDCTDDSCVEAAIGGDRCLHKINFNMCEDFVDCTYELVCDPEQPGLDPVSGCVRIPMHEWCDDNNPCTIDTCQPDFYLGEGDEGIPDAVSQHMDRCVHEEMNCDDCIKCTRDYCEDGACHNEAVNDNCDDHVACTHDVCNADLGKCENIPMDNLCPADGDDCWDQTCQPGSSDADEAGCVSREKECNDGTACTLDTCEEGQCVHTERDEECHDEAECTDDYCSSDLHKCVNVPNSDNCEDNSVCTIDVCNADGMCEFVPVDCSDDIHCTDDTCDSVEGCDNEANNDNCDDHIGCTEDTCNVDLGGCTNLPSHQWCIDNMDNACFTWYCNPASTPEEAGCYGVEIDCNDGLTCTTDSCAEGECVHDPSNEACSDGHTCTEDICNTELGCTHEPIHARCDDSDKCTEDICGCDGECHYVEEACNDQIACTEDYCDPEDGVCKTRIPDNACDDGIECTEDYCSIELGRCVNVPVHDACTDVSECTTGYCSIEKDCVYKAHHDRCDDNVPCTDDVCQDGLLGCANTPYDSLCDDGHGCTEDKCDTTEGCMYKPWDNRCEDGYNCTVDTCSTETGCHHMPLDILCDDGIECTDDQCTATGCANPEVNCWCSDGIACTVDTCNKDSVNADRCDHDADHNLCDDGWECSDDICDVELGKCRYVYDRCPWYGLGADDRLCVNCISANAQITQLEYSSGVGALQFLTKNPSTDELTANLVVLPTDQFIIGGESQFDVPVGSSDGLVLNDNLRIVPVTEAPECNEIRRGTIVVLEVEVNCGDEVNYKACHRDQIYVCSKQQGYVWVPLSK